MNQTPLKFLLPFGLLTASLMPAWAAPSITGDQVLRQMSGTLAAAKTFSFSAARSIDVSLLGAGGLAVAGTAKIDVLVQRPNDLSAHSVGRAGERQFIANGRTLTTYESKTNYYAVILMATTLDGLVARLDAKYGFTPPLVEFALSNPYQNLRHDADTVTYLGREKVGGGFLGFGGVECDQIALKGKEADAVLWIGASDHLPRKLVATFKNRPAKPQLRIDFAKWDLAAHATAADFTFTPPKGATKIEMWSVEKMQAASQR